MARPQWCAPTGFHGDDAARLLGKEAENFLSGKLLAEPDAAVGKGAMRLEGPLCKIETDNANLSHGCPLRSWDAKTSPPWHIAMPSGGASTPSPITRPWALLPQPSRKERPEFEHPAPDRFVGQVKPTFGKELLDITVAEGKAEIEPYCVLDDRGREAVAAIREGGHRVR